LLLRRRRVRLPIACGLQMDPEIEPNTGVSSFSRRCSGSGEGMGSRYLSLERKNHPQNSRSGADRHGGGTEGDSRITSHRHDLDRYILREQDSILPHLEPEDLLCYRYAFGQPKDRYDLCSIQVYLHVLSAKGISNYDGDGR